MGGFYKIKFLCYIGGACIPLALFPNIFNVMHQFIQSILVVAVALFLAVFITYKMAQKAVSVYLNEESLIDTGMRNIYDDADMLNMNMFRRCYAKLLNIFHLLLQSIAKKLMYYYNIQTPESRQKKTEIKNMQENLFFLGKTPEPRMQSGTYVCVSQNIDILMNRIFEYTFRDYVETWYATVSNDRGTLHKLVKSDFWETYDVFTKRLAKVDVINLVMNRYTKELLKYYRELDATDPAKSHNAEFRLHPCLRDTNCEKDFLRRVSEYIIRLCFPHHISSNSSSRVILREILAGLVFFPLIDTICDPDYINLSILAYISQREAAVEEKTRAYTYAATYEDFIRIISSAEDIVELRKIHRHIMTELLHATAISSLKRDEKKIGKAKSMAKGELLLSRDLKKYINQCQVARQQCEKRLRALHGTENHQFIGDKVDAVIASSVRLLTYSEVMASHMARSYFLKYLKSIGKGALLKYWCEVDIGLLKEPGPSGKEMAKIISHLYQTYVVPGSPDEVDIAIDKSTLKGMENCVLGNKGCDDFIIFQKHVSTTLEVEHFPTFLVSDFYIRQLMPQLSDTGDALAQMLREDYSDTASEQPAAFGRRQSLPDNALTRLKEIEDRLEYKAQALESLRPAAKQDHKLTRVLEGEIKDLQREKYEQQLYIERTDMWWTRMGGWRASIKSVSLPREEDGQTKYPIYTVFVLNSDLSLYEGSDDVSEWTVDRNLEQFQQLHQELKKFQPSIKKRRLPTLPVLSFGSLSQKFLESSKTVLNNYLTDILNDEILSRSEILYAFLSSATSHVNKKEDVRRKRFAKRGGISRASSGNLLIGDGQKMSLWQLGSLILTLPRDILDTMLHQEDDFSDSEDDESLKDVDPDSIAAPMYELISEIFEIHGIFRALRKTLIIFVRLAFGGSINKQIRETVQWLVSEPMLTFYLQTFIESMWPDGKLKPRFEERTEEEVKDTALEAQVKFLENVPEALQNLIGHENARRGFSKIFLSLQDKRLNKHLFYKLLEETVEEVFPEILNHG